MYGSRLKFYITKYGKSQQEVARDAEIPESSLSNFLRQEYPPLDVIVKVCRVLDVPVPVFFSDPESRENTALDEKEYKFITLFKKLPVDLQADAITSLDLFIRAWMVGRKGNGGIKCKK